MAEQKINLYDYIVKSAKKALSLQKGDGSMPAGHNGPYFDTETPVRNTCHWLITFIKAFEITKNENFKAAAQKALNYIASEKARPYNASFWHRKGSNKDRCNGLMGQAWSIEALLWASDHFDNPDILKIAKDVFLMHPFSKKYGIWQRVEINGTALSFDQTFNHQLWFAAVGSLLGRKCQHRKIKKRTKIFMNKLNDLLTLHDSGLIIHRVKLSGIKYKIKKLIGALLNWKGNNNLILKEIGYHQFNLYGLALLKECYPEHPFWKSKKFRSLWNYANSEDYKNNLYKSKYGFPYNPPGFEMCFALEVFGGNNSHKRKKQKNWLSEQFRLCFNFNTNLMDRNTEDPTTHAARIYEAVRLPDFNFEI